MHKERKFPISVSYVKCRLLVEVGEGGSLPSGVLGVGCFYFGNLGGGGDSVSYVCAPGVIRGISQSFIIINILVQ